MNVLKKFLRIVKEYARMGVNMHSAIRLLEGEKGVWSQKVHCGCFLEAEHQPEKCLWIFTMNYSDCVDYRGRKNNG